ncbi:MAG: helix-turn-helix transcriptional regulator [Clostridiales bacterium]|nr:helix-turn-helix transcriptional regulator [Clostridiales bacterium]
MDKEILKGIIDILILKIIRNSKEIYGYKLAKEINDLNNGQYEIKEGTLYLALKRLTSNKYLENYWKDSNDEVRKRKYYKITTEGIIYLEEKESTLEYLSELIKRI